VKRIKWEGRLSPGKEATSNASEEKDVSYVSLS
jgi:hypothetical protein